MIHIAVAAIAKCCQVIKPKRLQNLFPEIKESYVQQPLDYGRNSRYGDDWRISCYMVVMENWKPKIMPHEPMLRCSCLNEWGIRTKDALQGINICPTLVKGKSSSKVIFDGIWYVSSQDGMCYVKQILYVFQRCNDVRACVVCREGTTIRICRDSTNKCTTTSNDQLHVATSFCHKAKPIQTQRPTILQIQKSIEPTNQYKKQ